MENFSNPIQTGSLKLPKPVPLKKKLDSLASKFNTYDQEDSESMEQVQF